MKMIAAAKFRKNHHAILEGRLLSYHLYDVSTKIVNSFQQQAKEKSPVLMSGGPQDAPKLLIIFGADQGLCGGYSGNIIRASDYLLKKWVGDNIDFRVMPLGIRSIEAIKNQWGRYLHPCPVDAIRNIEDARNVTQYLKNILEKGEISEVHLISSWLQHVASQPIRHLELVPFSKVSPIPQSKSYLKSKENEHEDEFSTLMEPSYDVLLERICTDHLSFQLYHLYKEKVSAEQAARMNAMDSANTNAKDMLQRLDLLYNRTRQTIITNEIIEIVAGAQAV